MKIIERLFSAFFKGLPPRPGSELSEEELRRLRDRIETSEETLQQDTAHLIPEDFRLIGEFIQAFCVADLYARRILENERYLSGKREPFNKKLNDFDVLQHLKKSTPDLPIAAHHRVDLQRIYSTLMMHRSIRHFFAHWAVRRAQGFNALVCFTSNRSEAEKSSGMELDVGAWRFVVLDIATLGRELGKLKKNTQILIDIAADFESAFPEINQRRFEDKKVKEARQQTANRN